MRFTQYKHLLSVLICLVFWLPASAQEADTDMRAYALYNKEGKEISYPELIEQISRYQVVFLGEFHNCPISHWLELKIVQSLYQVHQEKLMIGKEMFESDNQLVIDEYMKDQINQERFESEARIWKNYPTDYAPIVQFAKEKGIPLIATNVPRRYANSVSKQGLDFLNTLSEQAKQYMAPLPIAFEYQEAESKQAFGGMGHSQTGNLRYMAQAQALKDATMAWFIAKNIQHHLVHINGNYHSNSMGGIIPYLLRYKPGLSVVTLSTLKQASIEQVEEKNIGTADFYICVPSDMTTTY